MNLWIDIARPRLLEVLQQVDLLVLNDAEARELSGRQNLLDAADHLLALGPRHLVVKLGEHGALLASRGTDAAPRGTSVPLVITPCERSEPDVRTSSPPPHHPPLLFRSPAIPLRTLVDPTGAGDSFLGALAGHLAARASASASASPAAAPPESPPAPSDFSVSAFDPALRRDPSGAVASLQSISLRSVQRFSFSHLCHALLRGTVAASFTCEAFSTRRLENLSPADFANRLDSLRQLTAWPEEEMLKS